MAEVIYSYTPRQRLNQLERLSLASFIANGHHFVLYSYAPVDNLPEGAERRDAALILPAQSPVGIRRFRWEMLYRTGGVWADPDMVALRTWTPPAVVDTDDRWICAFESINSIGTGVIQSSPRHSLAAVMRRKSRHPRRFALCHPGAWATGHTAGKRALFRSLLSARDCRIGLGEQLDGTPELTRVILRHSLSTCALPPYHFYPVARPAAYTLFDKTYHAADNPFPDSTAVCLYATESPYREKAVQYLTPDDIAREESFVGALARKYPA